MRMPCSREEFICLMEEEAGDVECDTCIPGQLELTEPPWFDEKLFTRGRKYILQNFSAQMVACLIGLISVLAVPSSLTILIHTNKSSTALSAYRRYLSTILHVYSWLGNDLRPGTESWKSLLTVRKRHLRVNQAAIKSGDGKITQRDLVITLFGFFGYGLLKHEKVGMWVDNEKDEEAYLHFWRTIGFMIGIHDKYNFCDGSINEAKAKMQYISEDILKPHLQNPPEYFYHMVNALLDGMFYVSPFTNTKASLYFAYTVYDIPGFGSKKNCEENATQTQNTGADNNNYVNCSKNGHPKFPTDANANELKFEKPYDDSLDGERLLKSMTLFERIIFSVIILIYQHVLFTPIGRWIVGVSLKATFLLIQYVPYIAILSFGLKRSFVNMFEEDVAVATRLKTNQEVLKRLYSKN